MLPRGGSFLYLAADRAGTNIAILRTAVNKARRGSVSESICIGL